MHFLGGTGGTFSINPVFMRVCATFQGGTFSEKGGTFLIKGGTFSKNVGFMRVCGKWKGGTPILFNSVRFRLIVLDKLYTKYYNCI